MCGSISLDDPPTENPAEVSAAASYCAKVVTATWAIVMVLVADETLRMIVCGWSRCCTGLQTNVRTVFEAEGVM